MSFRSRNCPLIVKVGGVRMTVKVEDVRLGVAKKPRPAAKPAARAPERKRAGAAGEADRDEKSGARTRDNTLDVRGERVDEALGRLDRFLDQSLLGERDVVFVIHGHGTGALKAAVRDRAASHPAVEQMRPGTTEEGGDGVTVLWLDVTA